LVDDCDKEASLDVGTFPRRSTSSLEMPVDLDAVTFAHTFPMVRAGGVFILIMGSGVVLGAVLPKRRRLLLILGAAVATIISLNRLWASDGFIKMAFGAIMFSVS
jgi:hypothetical protein